MPTFETADRFLRDFENLTQAERAEFRDAVGKKGLRVKGVKGARGVYELTWADDGRATFQYGESVGEEPHVIWRRVGTHAIFRQP